MNKYYKMLIKYIPYAIIALVVIAALIVIPQVVSQFTQHTHAYGEWENYKAPTCANAGIDRRYCDCGDVQEKSIDKLEHTEGDWIVDTERNEKRLYCSVCGYVIKFQSLGDHTHSYGEWTIEIEATCKEGGIMARYCRCGAKEEKAIKVLDHEYGTWKVVKEATCTERGLKRRECSCGAIDEEEIPMIEHTYGSFVEILKPTCDQEGQKEQKCSVCNATVIEYTPPLGHRFGEWSTVTQATCKEEGAKRRYCTNDCGVYEEEILEKTQKHSFGSWTTISKPTMTSTGIETRKCSVCNLVEENILDKLTYNPDDWTVDNGKLIEISSNITGSVVVPSIVNDIGTVFNENKSITSITLPDTVTTISNKAFFRCTKLTTIKLPNNLTSIGAEAFSGCGALTSISISATVNSIGNQAFAYCYALKTITYGGSIDQWNNLMQNISLGIDEYSVKCADGTLTITK